MGVRVIGVLIIGSEIGVPVIGGVVIGTAEAVKQLSPQ
jgi:hypothetical protein